jgi:protein ImuB
MRRILCIWLPDWPPQRPAAPAEHDRRSLESLAAWCQRFSPLVGIEAADRPASLLLDITGLDHLFGGEAVLAEQIGRDFAARGLNVRLAAADTIGAAWAVAHFGMLNSGFTLIPPGHAAAALGPLPIEALRLPPEIVDLLQQLGIRRIGQLESLPRPELSARFGPRLAERWDQALGRRSEPLPACGVPPRFTADWTPEYPAARREIVEAAVERLVGRLAAMLARCGRGAMRLQCRLAVRQATQAPLEIAVGLFQPTARPRHLFELLQLQLERLRLPGPVEKICLEAAVTAPLEYRQQELFADDSVRWQPRRLAGLVERLSSRLGFRAVLRARLMPDAQPELACRYDAAVGNKGGRRKGRGFRVQDLKTAAITS